jgi:hypothetical protein
MKKSATNRHGIGAVQHPKPTSAVLVLGLAGLINFAVAPNSTFAAGHAYTFEVVTTVGSAAPGGGAFVSDFEPTALNNHGQLIFTAEPNEPGEEGVFLAGGGTIQQIVRFGQSAPGSGAFSLYELGIIGLNDSGDAAFGFMLEPLDFGPPVNGGLYRWSHSSETLSPAVVPNVTPDPNGGVFVGVEFNASLNNRGDVAFIGYVTNTPVGLGEGFFIQSRSGGISSIARAGESSPDGGTFILSSESVATAIVINDAGDAAFEGNTTLDSGADNKLYFRRAATGKIELIPQPPGVVRQTSLVINNRGDIVFGGHYPDRGQGGVYLRRHGETWLIAKVGGPAPGGGMFSYITGVGYFGDIALNNAGDIAFEAATAFPDGSIDEAVYYYSAATQRLRRLAGIGTVLPGYGTVVSLEQVGALVFPGGAVTGIPFSYMNLNDRGQVAFAASATDGVTVYGVLLLGSPQGL